MDGDDLVFPVGAGPATTTNDLPNLLVRSLSISSPRTFTGNGIRLQAGLTIADSVNNTVTFALPIQLTAAQTWTIGTSDSEAAVITAGLDLNGSALTMNVMGSFIDGELRIDGVISGTGELVKAGPGVLILNGGNTYAGPTRINQGFTEAALSSLGVADGTAANGTTVETGGTLRLATGVFPNEAFSVSGWLTGDTTVPGPITVTGQGRVTVSVAEGVISGGGTLRTGGAGAMTLRNTNTYTGGTLLDLPSMSSSFQLFVEAHEAIGPAPALNIPDRTGVTIRRRRQTLGDLTGRGALSLESTAVPEERATLILNGAGDATFQGGLSGDGLIRHTGTGRQAIRATLGSLTGSAAATVEHGTLEIGSTFQIPIGVETDGRLVLSPTASVGVLTVTGGELALLAPNIPSLGLSMTAGTLEASIQTNQLSRLTVNGPVSLGNSTLSITVPATFAPPLGTELALVDHVPAGPVTGTFAGLPEGTEFVAGGTHTFRITYVGGDGNDIVLTLTEVSRDYLLSEGATSVFFTTDILIANPSQTEAPATVTFFPTGAAPVSMGLTLPALSRRTIRVNDIPELAGAEFSTLVRSTTGGQLLVERTMSWDATGYGAHTEHATEALSNIWYFAEGSQGFFQTYLLLANPQDTSNVATVEYLRTDEPPITRTYDLTPRSRRTVDLGADSDLVNRSFGITVTFAQPGMAERAMYFGTTPFLTGGHESAGVTAPSPEWFVAEGATGPFFETFILLANPGDAAVDATLTFIVQDASPQSAAVSIPAKGRVTVNIEQQHERLANAAVATRVTATGPVIVERAQYWPDPTWYEAHNSFGVTALHTRWGLAEGRVGMARAYQTYILLANPTSPHANVTMTFLRDGKPPVTKQFVVVGQTRLNVSVGPGTMVPELEDETFGVLVVSDKPIAVDRAMYSDANGQIWAAGTSATAVPVP